MKSKFILIAIILIGSILRLYKLGDIPQGIYVDEPSLGFNTYTILKYGVDEHNVPFPLSFRAFGEYKLPGYIYLSVPFVAAFGLNAFSIRLLSALAGIAGIYGTYLVTKQLSNNKKELVPLLAALFFALSPWSIHLSRAAFEANVALTLTIFATFFFLKFTHTHKTYQSILSVSLFLLSLYTYNSARLFAPAFVIILLWLHLNSLRKKETAIYVALFTLGCLPAMFGIVSGGDGNRLKTVFELGNKQYMLGPILGTIEKYFTHFSGEFLFFNGDYSARQTLRELGVMFFPQLPFLLYGLYTSAKEKSKSTIILFSWLLLAPIPSALATPVPHALRSLTMLAPLMIFTAIGVGAIYDNDRKNIFRKVGFISVCSLVLIFSFATYLHVYYGHYPTKTAWDWNEDKTLLGKYLAENNIQANKIYIEAEIIDTPIFIKFFNATLNKSYDQSKYIYFNNLSEVAPEDGDMVIINGWKGTPGNLTNVQNLTISNDSIAYKVGYWKTSE
jgi:4-amino-4-deoxy-L-arabinose transferase-like glycosyltransferase